MTDSEEKSTMIDKKDLRVVTGGSELGDANISSVAGSMSGTMEHIEWLKEQLCPGTAFVSKHTVYFDAAGGGIKCRTCNLDIKPGKTVK